VATNLDRLTAALFEAANGGDACYAINELSKHAQKGNKQAKEALALYVTGGSINHMRAHACSCLAESVTQPGIEFVALFRKGLSDPDLRYWSILGYVNSVKGAYEDLTRIAEDASIPVADRAHGVKCLARFSRQTFDRGLPSDPGRWQETELRLSELRTWANGGFPFGTGYLPPSRDPALDQPTTAFERIVTCLERKLAKKRQLRQDLADPTDWLAIAAPDDIQRIKARWHLPSTYLEFLTRFSPIKVTIEGQPFHDYFQLFGAGELIEAQQGYSFNPMDQQPIEGWPAHLVVIGSDGGDPYVLNLSESDGNDAPVQTAEHGVGVWQFSRVAHSFCELLEQLAN
jgi:hypothetical protein